MTSTTASSERRAASGGIYSLLLAASCLLLAAGRAGAATYYVRTDGSNNNTGTSNTSSGAWRTIDWAANHVAAGDVIRVQAGTYVEVASPGVNGTSGNTVTLVADGAVTTCGINFSGRSYIRVIGFNLNPTTNGCSAPGAIVNMSGTNKGLEFWNDDVGSTQGKGYIADFYVHNARCDSCIIFGGSVHDIGNPGTQVALGVAGNDVFVGYINFTNICYVGNGPTGNRQRYINNDFTGFIQCSGAHPDFFYIHGLSSLGYSNSLVESSFANGTPTATDNKEFHAENQQATPWNDNVWRFNVAHDLGSGFFSVYTDGGAGASNRWRFYNNSILNCDRASTNIYANGCGGWAFAGSAYIHNTLFYRAWSDASTINNLEPWGGFGAGNTGTITADYNLAFDPGGSVSFASSWTNQAHEQSNVNPQLNNVANDDFTLQSGSGARGVGGPLTTANGSGTSSTSLTVAPNTGSFFIGDNASNLPPYGGKLVPGDFITVGLTTVQVSRVSGDTLTLASPISWNNGDPVYLGFTATPDIGAYPYKAGGYTLTATYSQSGGFVTVTPSDASLVRFVVCYEDGIPTTVANSSPYTCSVGNGSLDVRVYPLYASKTLSISATPVSGAGVPCDMHADSSVNALDLQALANEILKSSPSLSFDINKDGSVNAPDLQTEANVVLGKASCP